MSLPPDRSDAPTSASPSFAGPLAALSLSMLLASLGTSIANIALPDLATAFSAPFREVQWIVLAYLVAITALVVGAGRLGDLYGRRPTLVAGLALFTLSSTLAGLAPSLGWLVAARALQGAGAAVMMALTLAFVAETVPASRTGRAMGLLGTMSAIGTALGPSLGGLSIAAVGWRAVFLVVVPLGLIAVALALRFLPAPAAAAADRRPRFDLLGTALLALTLAAYALAMTLGHDLLRPANLALFAAALVGLGLFVLRQTTAAAPLVRLDALRDGDFAAALAANALVAAVILATLVVGPFYLGRVLGLGTAAAGLVLSVGPVVSALTGVVAGRAVDRFGAPPMVVAGLAAMATGAAAFTLLPAAFGVAGYVGALLVLTPGYQLFQAANNTAVMADVEADRRGVISGLLTLSRNLGLVTGAVVMGAVFGFGSGTTDPAAAGAAAVAAGFVLTFAVAAGMILAAILLTLAGRLVRSAPGDAPTPDAASAQK